MPTFYALVDAVPGQEEMLEPRLKQAKHVLGVARCREGNYDFLLKIDATGFEVVDDILRTYVHRLPGIKGSEPIADWADYGEAVKEAKAQLG